MAEHIRSVRRSSGLAGILLAGGLILMVLGGCSATSEARGVAISQPILAAQTGDGSEITVGVSQLGRQGRASLAGLDLSTRSDMFVPVVR